MDFKWILSYIPVHRIFVLSINYDVNVFLFLYMRCALIYDIQHTRCE